MKTYSIIATIAIALLLTACSTDEEQTNATTVIPNKVQNFDSFDMTAKDGDSITYGDPIKPKGKD